MEKTIEIDGRPVTFRATAAIPRLYRLRFHRDIMQDMAFMRKEILKAQKEKKSVPVDILDADFYGRMLPLKRHPHCWTRR